MNQELLSSLDANRQSELVCTSVAEGLWEEATKHCPPCPSKAKPELDQL